MKQTKQGNVLASAAALGALWGGAINQLLNREQIDTKPDCLTWRATGAGYVESAERTAFLSDMDDLLAWFPVED